MIKLRYGLLLGIFLGAVLLGTEVNARQLSLQSPNARIHLDINVLDKIYYSVSSGDELLLENCFLTLELEDRMLGIDPKIRRSEVRSVNEVLKPVVPLKNAEVPDQYNELEIVFRDNYSVIFRAYNDGLAYRFVLDERGEVQIVDEAIEINFKGNAQLHLQQTPSFKTSYEYPYTQIESQAYSVEDKMTTLPVLAETESGYSILISESDLFDYPCMFLKGTGQNGLQSAFPKCPTAFGYDGDRSMKIEKEARYIARTSGKRPLPWRYFVISKDVADIVGNEMTYKLASECKLDDTSWIKPGQVSWEWWNGASPYGPDVDFETGCNTATYKYFIDFASHFGIPYIIMDEGWAASTKDPFTPNAEVDVFELIRYGKEKGVGVVLWLTWVTVEENFGLFEVFHDWGVAGVKIDFMDRSDQWMVNYYERVAKEAAKHKLFVNFHGSFKPAGLERAYPNVLSYEGVRGLEQMGGAYPNNTVYLPFIRNAVGAMDYTPGAMISMQPEVYCSRRPNSAGIGTRTYQMALFVVFESGLQMLADNPTNYYRERECTEFITQVPTTWDETRVLEAEAGQYIIVAKRKGTKWYLGGIANSDEQVRDFGVKLDFLDDKSNYTLTMFEDGANAGKQAMDYRKRVMNVNADQVVPVRMVRNGGWAAVIE